MKGPDGTIMHAELMYNDSVVMLGPESPERGGFAPQAAQSVTLFVYVENVDEQTARAQAAGATVLQPAMDQFWGDRTSIIKDPDGYTWMLGTHIKDVAPEDMHP